MQKKKYEQLHVALKIKNSKIVMLENQVQLRTITIIYSLTRILISFKLYMYFMDCDMSLFHFLLFFLIEYPLPERHQKECL